MWISSKNRRGVLGLGKFQREVSIGIDHAVTIGTYLESAFAKSLHGPSSGPVDMCRVTEARPLCLHTLYIFFFDTLNFGLDFF